MWPPLTRVFHCPKCNRVIRTTDDQCKYCSAPIDRRAAEAAADREDKISQAGLDAERIHGLVDVARGANDTLFWPCFFALPYFFILWLIRYRGLPKNDPDLVASRRTLLRALALWVPLAIALYLLLS